MKGEVRPSNLALIVPVMWVDAEVHPTMDHVQE